MPGTFRFLAAPGGAGGRTVRGVRLLRRLLKLLVVLIVLVAVAYALFATVLRLPPGGPLDSGALRSTGRTNVSVGDSVTFLVPVVRNRSGRAVTIEKIEPMDVPRGLRVRGVRLVSRLPGRARTTVNGWPPRLRGGARVRKAKDVRLRGRRSFRPAVGLRAVRPGTHVVRGLRVEFRDRGLRRVAEIEHEYSISARR